MSCDRQEEPYCREYLNRELYGHPDSVPIFFRDDGMLMQCTFYRLGKTVTFNFKRFTCKMDLIDG